MDAFTEAAEDISNVPGILPEEQEQQEEDKDNSINKVPRVFREMPSFAVLFIDTFNGLESITTAI